MEVAPHKLCLDSHWGQKSFYSAGRVIICFRWDSVRGFILQGIGPVVTEDVPGKLLGTL